MVIPRLYCFLGALASIPPRGKPGHCPRQIRKKMEGRGGRTNRLAPGLTGKDFRLREQGCGCFQPLQDRQAKAGRTWTRCSVLAPAVCCDLCGPHYLSSRSQPLGFPILLLLCCILGNLLRAMFQFRIFSSVLSDWRFWRFFWTSHFSEAFSITRTPDCLYSLLMVSILYFTFLKHFLFIWRQISDSTMPGQGRSSPQCTPGPSPLLGTQSHLLDHLGCSAQLCPFPLGNKLPTSEVSSAPDMLSHHTPSTTCAWVGSICLILGFSPLSADINHILHLSYTQCLSQMVF